VRSSVVLHTYTNACGLNFLERGIFTLSFFWFFCLYFRRFRSRLGVRSYSHTSFVCRASVVFHFYTNVCGLILLEQGIFPHFFRLFIFVCRLVVCGFRLPLIVRMFVTSLFVRTKTHHTVNACFRTVTGRHDQSRIVTIRVNLATRLGPSRSGNIFRGRSRLPEVHFRLALSRNNSVSV